MPNQDYSGEIREVGTLALWVGKVTEDESQSGNLGTTLCFYGILALKSCWIKQILDCA